MPFETFVLWGSAGHAKVLADVISARGGRIVALFDNNPGAEPCLADVPLFHGRAGFEGWLRGQGTLERIAAGVAIGGARGADRRAIADLFKEAGLALPPLVHPHASVSPTAVVGEASHVLAHAVVAADVSIGRACIVNNAANVDHESRLADGVHLAPGAMLCGCVDVGENVLVGAGAVVLPRITIGKGAVIGAGSVVTKDVPEGVVVVGNPARIMRKDAR